MNENVLEGDFVSLCDGTTRRRSQQISDFWRGCRFVIVSGSRRGFWRRCRFVIVRELGGASGGDVDS